MPSKVLQVPTIISIDGSTIRVKHPDISKYTKTTLNTPFTAGGVSLAVRDNNNFEDNDWFIMGELGYAKTEECDVNGAVTRGTALTITNSSKFDHELDSPVTRIQERGFRLYGAATDGGSGTLIESVDALAAGTNQLADTVMIQWDRPFSEWTIISTDTSYAFYYVTFHDGTTESSASDYVPAAGLAYNTGYALAEAGLNRARAEVDGRAVTWEFLLDVVNDFQDEVAQYVLPDGTIKNWPFEEFEDKTSITLSQNENEYAVSSLSSTLKYPDSLQGIVQVKAGADILEPIDLDEYEDLFDGIKRTEVATEANAGDTTLVVDDTSEFADSGTIYVGADTVTYTAKDDDTNTFSGIPASGTGSITATRVVDTVVWQSVSPGAPDKYTVYNNQFLLNKPINSTYAGRKLKVKAYQALARMSSLADTTLIPFTHIASYYIAAQIEFRKKNTDSGNIFYALFEDKLKKAATKHMEHADETVSYYDASVD